MGRPSNSEERRGQIVDGLLEVMARQGYAQATIAAIGKAAGLTPGLLHYHFETKQDILVALVERLTGALALRVQRRLEAAGDAPRARLHAFLDAYVAMGEDADPRAVAAWVVVGAEAVREPQVRALYTQAVGETLRQLRELLGECLRDEGRGTRQVGRMAAGLLSAIEGAYRVSAAAPGVLPEGFAAPTLRRMADGMLDAEERT
ncbi:TetR/AcrR family transcriptional regulator [Aggregicoccus sp. 17bor-14]|uniref:TetR/AcrR family transcriptional regulator n=1 Tax=Myxococcaceae TaxID=31 RepID=UPI00129CDA55|nr:MULTISPECIES: TetR/AcrR family transcriptional regulator [Myxococcaceae]MBF5045854.1 TetR family transcriptional regulator C-terminal domain-containing protein [Simulacricoccus sp. 17bor-14]MRI91588.1 TetR/AcrR family transcriptional regulator [Aggregicoccus sp. 17bor-14]